MYLVDIKGKFDSKWKQVSEHKDFFEAVDKAIEISKTHKPLWIAFKVRVYDFDDDRVVMTINRPLNALTEDEVAILI